MDLDALAEEEAAKALSPGTRCWVCSIPERDWIERARKAGRTLSVIAAVLVRTGYTKKQTGVHRLSNHLNRHVR